MIIWKAWPGNSRATAVTRRAAFDAPEPAEAVRLGVTVRLDQGWLGFSNVRLAVLSEPLFLVAAQEYVLAATVAGQVNAPAGQDAVALALYAADGLSLYTL